MFVCSIEIYDFLVIPIYKLVIWNDHVYIIITIKTTLTSFIGIHCRIQVFCRSTGFIFFYWKNCLFRFCLHLWPVNKLLTSYAAYCLSITIELKYIYSQDDRTDQILFILSYTDHPPALKLVGMVKNAI